MGTEGELRRGLRSQYSVRSVKREESNMSRLGGRKEGGGGGWSMGERGENTLRSESAEGGRCKEKRRSEVDSGCG